MKSILTPTIAILLFASTAALAQFQGLPVASSAGKPDAGNTCVAAGLTLSDDFNLYAARLSFAPVSFFSLFADLGAMDPDSGDFGPAIQGGFIVPIPIKENPVDLALRAAWAYTSFDFKADGHKGDATANSLNFGCIVSRDFDRISPYVFLGLQFTDSTVKFSGNKASSDDTDLAATAGLLLHVTQSVSLYAELAYIDDPFFSIGFRNLF